MDTTGVETVTKLTKKSMNSGFLIRKPIVSPTHFVNLGMQLKTRVKVGEVTNLSDARYCAGMGVEYIGFNLDIEGERAIDATSFTAITQWLEGVTIVGEFKTSGAEHILETIEKHHLKCIEVSDVDLIGKLKASDVKVFLRLDETLSQSQISAHCDQLIGKVEAFIIDSPLSWDSISALSSKYPIITSHNLGPDSLEENLSKSSLYGISLKGGDEERPGFKSFDELADILEVLEIDDY